MISLDRIRATFAFGTAEELTELFACFLQPEVTDFGSAGVYALWRDDRIVYVGKSRSSMGMRIMSHASEGKKFKEVSLIPVHISDDIWVNDDEGETPTDARNRIIGHLESYAIFTLAPEYNRALPFDPDCPWAPMHVLTPAGRFVKNGTFTVRAICIGGRYYVEDPSNVWINLLQERGEHPIWLDGHPDRCSA
jgi:hypothetical protein